MDKKIENETMISTEVDESKIGFNDALEGRPKAKNSSAYVWGYYKGLDAAKFLGVNKQDDVDKDVDL